MSLKRNIDASLSLVDLDFYSLKNSFKNYLRTQPYYKDYDFNGSNINMLLDLLSYNTHKLAFYLNMSLSERFFDSAQLRNSLLSHAKDLNYIPRSVRSSVARVRVNFQALGDSQPYIIQKGSQFSTMIKSEAFTFTTPETFVCSSANSSFQFETEIYEGIYVRDSYVVQDTANQTFKITNKNVDTRSVTVTVFEDSQLVGDIYKFKSTLLDLTDRNKVFFIQTNETGHYEVLFGDNILGYKPKVGSTVVLDYRVSSGPNGDGARVFNCDFDPTSKSELSSTVVVETIEASHNGTTEEDNESVRYYAPRSYQVQERTVVGKDYEIALKTQFPEINAVTVFGGEELDPPQFGKVFVSVDISNVEGLPPIKKDEYYKFLDKRSPFGLRPVFIEPNFIYVSVNSIVRYNLNLTSNSPNRIKTLVTDVITSYNRDNLNDFDSFIRYSELVGNIDDCDKSMVSNLTDLLVYKKLNPVLSQPNDMLVEFKLSLDDTLPTKADVYPSNEGRTVYSSGFRYNNEQCILEDDGNGRLNIIRQRGTQKIKLLTVGTVDYETGAVKLSGFNPERYDGNALKIYAVPRDRDIYSPKNNLMSIETDEINITVEELRL